MHDLRARGLRAWVVDGAGRPIVTTAMVHEGEGAAEERRVLGDTLPAAVLRDVGPVAGTRIVQQTVSTASGRARLYGAPLPEVLGAGRRHRLDVHSRPRCAVAGCAQRRSRRGARGGAALGHCRIRPGAPKLAPVTAMSQQADRIGAANLHERLPVTNPHDELGHLAETFNRMLDRVDNAFEQQRRFMADASHELRTPVAILRGEADIALLSDGRTREEYRGALVVVHDAADRLSRTVNDIFLLARVDASQVPTAPAPLYLDELVADTCRAMRSLAAQRGVTLTCETAGEIPYVGDSVLLERLVMNLVDNAIKYSDDGGTVSARLDRNAQGVWLTVVNGGPGIPAEAQPHVFDRFYRVDAARTAAARGAAVSSGSGLGLAIARWIAELHGGAVELTASEPGRTAFTFRLPPEPRLQESA